MPAIQTGKCPHALDFHLAALNTDNHALDQGLTYFFMRRLNNPPKSLPGNMHDFRRLVLIFPLVIRQSNCFKFIQGKQYFS